MAVGWAGLHPAHRNGTQTCAHVYWLRSINGMLWRWDINMTARRDENPVQIAANAVNGSKIV